MKFPLVILSGGHPLADRFLQPKDPALFLSSSILEGSSYRIG